MNIETVHFHIGVNNVYENLFSTVFCEPVLEYLYKSYHLVSDDDYVRYLGKGIDAGTPAGLSELLGAIRTFSREFVISRPKFLFAGRPLNAAGSFEKSLYKIDQVQEVFHNTRVVFHIFISDHVSYLMKKLKNADSRTVETSEISWLPLLDNIYKRIQPPNELWVWGAESAGATATKLIQHVMLVEEREAVYSAREFVSLDINPIQQAEQQNVSISETELIQLDLAYEKDLEKITTRPYNFINCFEL